MIRLGEDAGFQVVIIMEAGCSGYIEKPIDPDIFEVQVGKYLSMKVHKERRQ